MDVWNTVRSKLKEYRRVLKITKKPDREEFQMSAQVTGLGIIIVGTLGFLIYLIGSFLIPS
jgi:protein transport protein SEC61 subunit gamma-like protein